MIMRLRRLLGLQCGLLAERRLLLGHDLRHRRLQLVLIVGLRRRGSGRVQRRRLLLPLPLCRLLRGKLGGAAA